MTDDVGPFRMVLAKLVYFLHVGVVTFVTWAWVFPWPEVWWAAVVFIPLMLLHWKMADVCILTTLEMKLRGHPEAGTQEQGGFIPRLARLVGWDMSDETASKMGWGMSYWSLAVCGVRLYLQG